MPIESTHPVYETFLKRWSRCEDVFEGEDAVKEAGTTYLPTLGTIRTTEDQDDYNAYKDRASFVNFLKPTIRGIVGLLLRRDPVVEAPEKLKALIEGDMTLTGASFREWARDCAFELLTTGRVGSLTDYSADEGRPYVTRYKATQIVNWGDDWWVLCECYIEPDPADPFKQITKKRYRHLYFDQAGKYTVDVYEKPHGKDKFVIAETYQPKFRSKNLDEIPFVAMSAMGETEPCDPPLIDLVNVNISHYRTSADLEHGRHFTALPTPYATGLDTEANQHLRVGSQAAWIIPNPDSKVGMLEFSGAGLESLVKAKEEKAREMAQQGALMLMEPQKQAETAETARIHASGKTASLQDICFTLEAFYTSVLQSLAVWLALPTEGISVSINREFVSIKLTPQEMTALTDMLAKNAISYETFFWNLQGGLVMPPDRTAEDEIAAIKDAQAPTGPLPQAGAMDGTDLEDPTEKAAPIEEGDGVPPEPPAPAKPVKKVPSKAKK